MSNVEVIFPLLPLKIEVIIPENMKVRKSRQISMELQVVVVIQHLLHLHLNLKVKFYRWTTLSTLQEGI